METIFHWFLVFIFIKSVTIGSEFNFVAWIRHGKKYTDWYFSRPSFRAED